jgi:hypothetical protein
MGDGSGSGGQRILREETMRAMQSAQAAAGSMCEAIGFSWMIDSVGGHTLVKHGGALNGQLSSFEFIPSLGYACTVLTNFDSGREMRSTVGAACLKAFTGIEVTLPAAEPLLAATAGELAGEYRQRLFDLSVDVTPAGLVIHERTAESMRPFIPAPDAPPFTAALFAPDRAVVLKGSRKGERCEFLRDANGRVAWMRWDGRLSRRVDG